MSHLRYPVLAQEQEVKWSPSMNWYIQEKIDGSQFSFKTGGKKTKYESHGKDRSHDPLFFNVIDAIRLIKHKLNPEFTYHGEYLSKPSHRFLSYERRPQKYVVIYDIEGPNGYLGPSEVKIECTRVGLEFLRVLFVHSKPGNDNPFAEAQKLLKEGVEPHLGGPEIEGLVIKTTSPRIQRVANKEQRRTSFYKKMRTRTVEDVIKENAKVWNTQSRFEKAINQLKKDGIDMSNPREKLWELEEQLDKDLIEEAKKEIMVHLWGDLKKVVISVATTGAAEHYVTNYCPESEKKRYEKKQQKTPKKPLEDFPPTPGYLKLVKYGTNFATKPMFDWAIRELNFEEHSLENCCDLLHYLKNDMEHDTDLTKAGLWGLFHKEILCHARSDLREFLF